MTIELTVDGRIEAPGIEAMHAISQGYPTPLRKYNKMLGRLPLALASMLGIRPGSTGVNFEGYYFHSSPDGINLSAELFIEVDGAENADRVLDQVRKACEDIINQAFEEYSLDPYGLRRKEYIDALAKSQGLEQLSGSRAYVAERSLHVSSLGELKKMYDQLVRSPRKRHLQVVA